MYSPETSLKGIHKIFTEIKPKNDKNSPFWASRYRKGMLPRCQSK